jgi:plasmid stability protein
MVIRLPPDIVTALAERARQHGVAPEEFVLDVLRERLLSQDEWERRLFGAAIDCDVSAPDSALGSYGLYE